MAISKLIDEFFELKTSGDNAMTLRRTWSTQILTPSKECLDGWHEELPSVQQLYETNSIEVPRRDVLPIVI
jgi:hypothetical protein